MNIDLLCGSKRYYLKFPAICNIVSTNHGQEQKGIGRAKLGTLAQDFVLYMTMVQEWEKSTYHCIKTYQTNVPTGLSFVGRFMFNLSEHLTNFSLTNV